MEEQHYTLEELCALTDTPKRTVRFYIQASLVDRPEGATRNCFYTSRHLEQLLLIRRWQKKGLNLERIRELLSGDVDTVPERRPHPGDICVESRMFLTPGVYLCVDAQQSRLSPENLRILARKILHTVKEMTEDDKTVSEESNMTNHSENDENISEDSHLSGHLETGEKGSDISNSPHLSEPYAGAETE